MLGRTIAASLRAHRQHTEIEVVFACQSGDCSSLQLKADALWVGLTCFGLHGKRDAVHAFLTANGIAFEDER